MTVSERLKLWLHSGIYERLSFRLFLMIAVSVLYSFLTCFSQLDFIQGLRDNQQTYITAVLSQNSNWSSQNECWLDFFKEGMVPAVDIFITHLSSLLTDELFPRALWSECPSEEDWHFRHFPVRVRISWPNLRPPCPSVLPKVCWETLANMDTRCWSGYKAVGLSRRPLPDGWFLWHQPDWRSDLRGCRSLKEKKKKGNTADRDIKGSCCFWNHTRRFRKLNSSFCRLWSALFLSVCSFSFSDSFTCMFSNCFPSVVELTDTVHNSVKAPNQSQHILFF